MDMLQKPVGDEEEERPFQAIGPDGLTDHARAFLASQPPIEERQRRFFEWYDKTYPDRRQNWLSEITGTWPGDESDEELQAALKAMG